MKRQLNRTLLFILTGAFTFLTFLFCGADTASSAGFANRKRITIQASQVSGSFDLLGFPVMVRLTGSDFQEIEDDARPDGYDIVFRDSDGITPLAHEIEVYDEAADVLIAWVRIPILSPVGDTDIYIYYGDPTVTAPTETPTLVWDSNYKGVWHLKEDPSGAAPQIIDSTANANHGTSKGSMTSSDLVAGKMGNGLDFDGSNDYIDVGNDASLDATTGITLEGWVECDAIELVSRRILFKGNAYFLDAMRGYKDTPDLYVYIDGEGWQSKHTPETLTTSWNHFVGTYDSEEEIMRVYIDGILKATRDLSGLSNHLIRTTSDILKIGKAFDGIIDEARISDIARSADWIQTEFDNQSSPGTFHSVAGEEAINPDLPSVMITSPTSGSSYSTETGVIDLAGIASGTMGIVEVTWSNDAGDFGVCSGTDNWSAPGISLAPGVNVITVTARDSAAKTAIDVLTVTYGTGEIDDGDVDGGGDYGGAGDTEFFQTALEPNVLILFDTSGSMWNTLSIDAFNPEIDYSTPLLGEEYEVVFAQEKAHCYADWQRLVFITSQNKVLLRYIKVTDDEDICNASDWQEQWSDSDGYFYFDREAGNFISKDDYEGDEGEIKVFLPYAEYSVLADAPPIDKDVYYYSTWYTYNYLNWIFYHSTRDDRDELEALHSVPEQRAVLTRVLAAKKAVKELIDTTPGVRFGTMRLERSEADGGRIVADIPSSTEDLHAAIDDLWPGGSTPLAEALEDAWDYYRGLDLDGHSFTQDYWCRPNFVILMTDGLPTYDSNHLTSDMKKDWDGDNGGTEANGWTGDEKNMFPGNGSGYLDDVAYYIQRNDGWPGLDETQNVTTHAIGFTINNDLLEDTAINGGGQYYTAETAPELRTAFYDIIAQITDVSHSYTAPVVPVSRMERGTSEKRIYLALFKPTVSAFWKGNIKKYGIATQDSGDIKRGDILDRNEVRATDDSGHILDTAHSYWGTGPVDGGETEKGGVGELLLNRATPRKIYTYLNKKDKDLTRRKNAFTTENPMLTRVVLDTDDDEAKIIDFIHGLDAYDEDRDSDTSEKRNWILGAFLHSRPQIVYYNGRTVILAGANDGMLHAFDDETGEELWAYIPPVLLPRLKYLSGMSRVYYVDGSPNLYVKDVNHDGEINRADGDQAILLCGLRRGGRYYFALDVTDPLRPKIPKGWADWGVWESDTVWKSTGMIGPDMTTESGIIGLATYPYSEMGQSWSMPAIGKINDGGTRKDVAFVGGGYDRNQDTDNPLSDDETMGRGVYVVDLLTGDPLWKYTHANDPLEMIWSIPSDIAAVDTTGSGLIDRLYVGDMGGKLRRFDLRSSTLADWTTAVKILFDTNSPTDGGRKIFYPPDVTLEHGHEFVFFGTGDRAHPKTGVNNRIYAVKDRNPGDPLDEDDLEDVTDDLLQDPDWVGDKDALRAQILNGDGWYIRLIGGEKVLAQPVLFGGVAYLTTFSPTGVGDPCIFEEGIARLYALDYRTGEAVLNYDTESDAIGKSDRSLVIGTAIPSGLVMAFIEGRPEAYLGIRGGISNPEVANTNPLTRIYWRQPY